MNGPVQTWMLWGNQPVIWTVPIFAQLIDGRWAVTIALALRPSQIQTVESRLILAGGRRVLSAWMISPTTLPKIAEPVVGDDLEQFYSWAKPQLSQQDRFKPEKRVERDAFLDTLFAKGVGRSRSEVEMWWNRFCNHMVDWLLNHERPVDLYFGQLHPSPYRRLWKENVLATLKREGASPVQKMGRLRHDPHTLPYQLAKPRLLALTDRGFVRRSIEIELNAQWTSLSVKVEQYRLAALGPEKYATLTLNRLQDFLPHARRLFLAWLADTHGQSAAAVPRCPGGGLVLAKNQTPDVMSPDRRRFYHQLSIVMLREGKFRTSYGQRALLKNRELRPLPTVQPDTPDVRDPRPVLPGPRTY